MGNTVSAAEMAAQQILHPNVEEASLTTKYDHSKYEAYNYAHHADKYKQSGLAGRCPVKHTKKEDEQPPDTCPITGSASECPVLHQDKEGEINPLNMVRKE